MSKNESISILGRMSSTAAPEIIMQSMDASLAAAVAQGIGTTKRFREMAIPALRRVLKHPRATSELRVRAAAAIAMMEAKASPYDILARVRTDADRLVTAGALSATGMEKYPQIAGSQAKEGDPVPAGELVKLYETPAIEIQASKSGLLEEAQRLAAERGAPLNTDDILRAMDARFPYSKVTPVGRPLEELRTELPVYLELDAILATVEDDSNPLKIAANHRIGLMKQVPDGPEPLWFRQLRWRCHIDLFFLAKAVCGKRFTNYTHRALCEHLVLKNPLLPIEEQSQDKDRLTMCFRGFFKSTCSILDCVQWVIDFPNDIRIIILTSTLKLAKRFIGELKQYFMKPKGAQPTTFQALFPEFAIAPEEHGPVNEFTVKGRRSVLKDPTAWAASVGSDDIGSHCDLLIFDDAESADNSSSAENLENLAYKINMAKMLVDPGGYRTWIGTPYALNDIYFQMRNNIEGLKSFYKPVMAAKPEFVHKDQNDWTENDVVLAFPERLPWKVIQAAKREDPGVFQSQYMLNPSGESAPNFSMELLQQRTIPEASINLWDTVNYAIWDTAYTLNRLSDSSVGITASQSLTDGKVFIREIIQDKFPPEDLAEAIVDSYARHRHKVVIIENSLGAENLRPTILRLAQMRGLEIPLFFLPVVNKKGAKAARIAVLEPLLRSGRLFFSNSLSCLTELYEQFHFFGTSRHDDLCDAIALLFSSGYISQTPFQLRGEALTRTREIEQTLREKDIYEHIFCTGFMAEPAIQEQPVAPDFDESQLYDPFGIPGMRS